MKKKTESESRLHRVLLVLIAFAFLVAVGLIVLVISAVLNLNLPSVSPQVAVLRVKGTIGTPEADLDTIISLLEEAENDSGVGALVLDIDSPGGMPVATRELGEKIKQVKQKKPVVAWIGETGTSGGYWIATASDWVMADPLSVVGSIGVILEVPNLSGLMEKLGVQVTTIKGGDYKDMGSPYRNMTEEEKELLENISVQLHEEFVKEVAANREMDLNRTRELADGQIYLGRKALELNLIDELGTRDDAIEKAAELANIQPEWFYLEEQGLGPLLRQMTPEQPFWMPW